MFAKLVVFHRVHPKRNSPWPGCGCKRIICCVAPFVSLAQQWSRERRTQYPLGRLGVYQTDGWLETGAVSPMWTCKGFEKKKRYFSNTWRITPTWPVNKSIPPKHSIKTTSSLYRCCFPLKSAQNGLSWMNELMCGGEPSCHLRLWLQGTQIDRWYLNFLWIQR